MVYTQNDENEPATIIYHSGRLYGKDTMHLHADKHHVSLIKNIAAYNKSFTCDICRKMFHHHGTLMRHRKTCSNKTRFVYPGGFYTSGDSVFDELEHVGIVIPEHLRYSKFFVAFDFESVLSPTPRGEEPRDLTYTNRHIPVSFAICSNVPGHTEALCEIEREPSTLVAKLVEHLRAIRETAIRENLQNFEWVFDRLEQVRDEWQIPGTNDSGDKSDGSQKCPQGKSFVERLRDWFTLYCERLTCLGFNSAKYDLPLILPELLQTLNFPNDPNAHVIKKVNAYICLSTTEFSFLDVINFFGSGD